MGNGRIAWGYGVLSLFPLVLYSPFLLHDEMTTGLCRMVVVNTSFLYIDFSFLELVKSEIN